MSNLRNSKSQVKLLESFGLIIALILMVLVFSLSTDHFFTSVTFRTILNQIPDAILVAVGMTFVLIIAEIDLSVGSVLAFGSAVLGVCMVRANLPLPIAILFCLLTGLICGMVNGLITLRWKIPSFIVTLGMLEMARGATYLVTDSRTQYIGSSIENIASAGVFGISWFFFFAVAVVIVGQLLLTRTVFGRYMIAVGTNQEALRLSGVDPRPVKLIVFTICGFLASAAAIVQTARMASADPNAGIGYELNAIAAVVIGGTSLMGGRGSVFRSFLGVLIIGVLGAGLVQVGASDAQKRLITGFVIIAAVVLDYYRQKLGKAKH